MSCSGKRDCCPLLSSFMATRTSAHPLFPAARRLWQALPPKHFCSDVGIGGRKLETINSHPLPRRGRKLFADQRGSNGLKSLGSLPQRLFHGRVLLQDVAGEAAGPADDLPPGRLVDVLLVVQAEAGAHARGLRLPKGRAGESGGVSLAATKKDARRTQLSPPAGDQHSKGFKRRSTARLSLNCRFWASMPVNRCS